MQAPSGAPDWLEAFTAAERPDLWAQARDDGLFNGLWPVYNEHGNHTGRYFGALFPQHADLQVLLTDRRSGRSRTSGCSTTCKAIDSTAAQELWTVSLGLSASPRRRSADALSGR